MQFCPIGTFSYAIQYGDTLWIIAKRFNTTIDAIIMVNPGVIPDNLYVGQRISIPISSGFYNPSVNRINNNIFNMSNNLRLLWEQLGFWLRESIIANIFDLPDLEYIKARLFENPKHFSQVLIPFYGNEKALEFQKLMNDHLKIADEIIKACKKKNHTEALEREWEINADEMALFLSLLNPHWIEVDWQKLIYDHLRLIKDELTYYLNQDYRSGVALFDEIQRQALDMADMMTNGIIKQFPKQFYNLRKKK